MKHPILLVLFFIIIPTALSAQTIEEAVTAYNDQRYSAAEEIINTILETDKNNLDAQIYLCRIYLKTDRFNRAERLIVKLQRDFKDNARVHIERGNLELIRPRKSEALRQQYAERHFQAAFELDPNNKDASIELSNIYFGLEKYDKSFEILQNISGFFSPDNQVSAAVLKVVPFVETNTLKRIALMHPHWLQISENKNSGESELAEAAWGLFISDDLLASVRTYDRLISEFSGVEYDAYMDAGVAYFESEKFEKAINVFEFALEKMPGEIKTALLDGNIAPFHIKSLYADKFQIDIGSLTGENDFEDYDLLLRKYYHIAFAWYKNKTQLQRNKPNLNISNRLFEEPYLIHWGKYNYLEYCFYYLLNDKDRTAFSSIVRKSDRRKYFDTYFLIDNSAPLEGNASKDEFMQRIEYISGSFSVQPDKFDKTIHAKDFSGFDDRGKVYLKYGKPDDMFYEPGGTKKLALFDEAGSPVDVASRDDIANGKHPFLVDPVEIGIAPFEPAHEKFNPSGVQAIQVKPNFTWTYQQQEMFLNFEFAEIQKGYFTLVDNLDDASYGNDITFLLYMDRARKGGLGGLYEHYYLEYYGGDIRHTSTFFQEYLYPAHSIRNRYIDSSPNNVFSATNIYSPLDIGLNFAAFRAENGMTKLEIYTGVEFEDMTFNEANSRFSASDLNYRIDMIDAQNNVVCDTSNNVTLLRDANNPSENKYLVKQFNFILNPDQYRALISVINPESQKQSINLVEREIEDFSRTELSMSDIQLSDDIRPGIADSAFYKNGLIVTPFPYREVELESPLYIYVEAYNLSLNEAGKSDYIVEYSAAALNDNKNIVEKILNQNPKILYESVVSVTNNRQGDSENITEYVAFDFSAMLPGEIEMTVKITDKTTNKSCERSMIIRLFSSVYSK